MIAAIPLMSAGKVQREAMKNAKQTYEDWLWKIREHAHGLSKWEAEFVDSIAQQLEERGTLSDRQADILERIYSEKTPL